MTVLMPSQPQAEQQTNTAPPPRESVRSASSVAPFLSRGGWFLLGIEVLLVPACTALLGTLAGLPLAAVALCVPQVMAAAWIVGSRPALGLTFLSALGWYLPAFSSPRVDLFAVDQSSVVIGTAVLIAFVLLTQKWRETLRRAHEAAETDPLTKLLNRRGLIARVEAEGNRSQRSGSSLAIAFLDCDRFKQLNDTLGHQAGDRVLMECAAVLRANVRNYDSAARLGGDEFALLLPDVDEAGARSAAERVLSALHTAMAANEWPVTFSIGVAVFPVPKSAAEMINAADAEMYVVKRSGRAACRVRVMENPVEAVDAERT
jgi:diguanylate cyclase (GGDEF)-like protein